MSTPIDAERLRRLLGQPALTRLIERLRRRLELGGDAAGTISLTDASAAERQAVEQLLGRPPGRGSSVAIPLARLEQVLREAGVAPDLAAALASLGGPLRDRRAEAAQQQAAWDTVFREGFEKAPGLAEWLGELEAGGLLKRLARGDAAAARRLLAQALAVAAALPGKGQPLSTLAAIVLGDAHALDPGRPLATLAQKAAAHLGRSEDTDSPESRREVWANVGILVGGALTSVALVLNLPAANDAPTGRLLNLLREDGQPGWLTLRQLVRDPPAWRVRGRTVYVCENPAVVAEAAEHLGARAAPLVCGHGQPGAAVATLLRQLAEAGAVLAYHGDFDWPGVGIGNRMMERFGARPWRFDAGAYRTAKRGGKSLTGTPIAARWDEALLSAMQACGRCVEEEQVLDELLADLGGATIPLALAGRPPTLSPKGERE